MASVFCLFNSFSAASPPCSINSLLLFSLASSILESTTDSAPDTTAPKPGTVEAAPFPAPKATSLATSLKSAPVPTLPRPAPSPPAAVATRVPYTGILDN